MGDQITSPTNLPSLLYSPGSNSNSKTYGNQFPLSLNSIQHQICVIFDGQTGITESHAVIDLTEKGEEYVVTKISLSVYNKILEILNQEVQQEQRRMQMATQLSDIRCYPNSADDAEDYDDLKGKNKEECHIKGSWTEEEDRKLVDLVKQYGPKRWSFIASHLKGRVGKQCRERYLNHLSPNVCKKAWTPEEDAIIIDMHSKLGNQWAKISRMLKGRTANAVKNHWNSTLNRKLDKKRVDTQNESQSSDDASLSLDASPQCGMESPGNLIEGKRDLEQRPEVELDQMEKRRKRFRIESHISHDASPKTPGGSLKLETEEKMFNPFNASYGEPSPKNRSSQMVENPHGDHIAYHEAATSQSNPKKCIHRENYKDLTIDLNSNEEEAPSNSSTVQEECPIPGKHNMNQTQNQQNHNQNQQHPQQVIELTLPDTPQNFSDCGININYANNGNNNPNISQLLATPNHSTPKIQDFLSPELWSPRSLFTPKYSTNDMLPSSSSATTSSSSDRNSKQ